MGMFLIATLIFTVNSGSPVYILEPAGIEFGYLPEEICPLVEGTLTQDNGALAGQPNSLGITFGCYYWEMKDTVSDKNLWLEEKLSSVISPDLMQTIRTSEATWTEGSTATETRGSLSLGLMSEISFTFSPPGGVMGRGKAYGIFRNGYAVLITMYGPAASNPQEILDQIVSMAVLSE